MSEQNNSLDDLLDDILSKDSAVVMPVAESMSGEPEDCFHLTVGDAEEPMMASLVPSSRKKSRFFQGLLIYFLIFLAIGACFLFLFSRWLKNYESTTPNGIIERYLQCVYDKDYETIYENSGFVETALNTKADYLSYLQNLYGDVDSNLSVRQKPSADNTLQQYSLYSGDTKISTLLLTNLSHDGKTSWALTTQLHYQDPYIIRMTEDVHVKVNEMELSLLGLEATTVDNPFGDSPKDVTLPTVYEYTLENLLAPPKIVAYTLSNGACELQWDVENKNICQVLYPTTEEQKTTNQQLAQEVATNYAAFVAGDFSRTKLLSFVYTNSAFAAAVRNFSNSYAVSHTSYRFDDIKVSNYGQYSPSDFFCEVSFQPVYIQKKNGTETEKPGGAVHYRMTFIKDADTWKLLTLTNISDNTGETSTTTPTN